MRSGKDWGRLGLSFDEYLVVFDTNTLHINYNKKGDFTRFYFNATLDNVINKIEELDIYSNIKIALPVVVWEELKKQRIQAFNTKFLEVKNKIEKYKFPQLFYEINELNVTYDEFLHMQIEKYKKELDRRQVQIIYLDLPSDKRFSNIIARAFDKKAPFEGLNSNSDKGFKDALLWESILEYKDNKGNVCIMLYSKDCRFNEELEEEFLKTFNDGAMIICKTELEVFEQLEQWAKNIDKYVYIPPEHKSGMEEYKLLYNWVKTDDFKKQFRDHSSVFGLCSKYIKYNNIENIKILDILENNGKYNDNFL